MPGQLIPLPEDAPPSLAHLTVPQRIALWVDLMDACEALLLAGLRRKIGPDGDLRAAYRQWYTERMEEHDRTMFHMLTELDRRSRPHGG